MYNIFLSGNARSGKDTFCNIILDKLSRRGFLCRRVSFADALKEELYDFCLSNLGISPFTENERDKFIIRPILIAYGMAKRALSNNTYWLDKVKTKIDDLDKFKLVDVSIITDTRFDEDENDEVAFAKKAGDLVYIERFLEDGTVVPPVSAEEKKYNKKIAEKADYIISWGFGIDMNEVVDDFIESVVIEKINSKK